MFKNIKKYSINKVFLALLVIFFVAAGCGSSGSNSTPLVVLKIWGTFESQNNIMPMIQEYTAQYPNVQIVYTQKNVDTYEIDLLNALAAGTGPDIFAIHNDWLPKYQNKLVESTPKAFNLADYKKNFVDVAYNDFVVNGKIYAAPLSVDSLALFYNKDILGSAGIAVPPRTWDELKTHIKKITNQSGFRLNKAGVALGTSANINRAVDIIALLMLQNRVVPYSSDFSRPTFDQGVIDSNNALTYPAAQALDFYTSFADPGSGVFAWSPRSDYDIDAFANGDLAYMYGYSYFKDTLKAKAPNLNYDVAPVPQAQVGQTLVNYANYWGFAVSKQSKNANYAWSVISYMTQKASLQKYYKSHNLPSSRKDIISDQVTDPDIGIFASANLTAKSFYKKDQKNFDDIFNNMIDDVTLRDKTVDSALRSAAQQVNLMSAQ